jgi:hypothetical protein
VKRDAQADNREIHSIATFYVVSAACGSHVMVALLTADTLRSTDETDFLNGFLSPVNSDVGDVLTTKNTNHTKERQD